MISNDMNIIATMPYQKVGTKLGQLPKGTKTRPGSNSPSQLGVILYFHEHPARLFTLENLPERFRHKGTLDNCFHSGYILRGRQKDRDIYFYPNHNQVDSLKKEFTNIENGLDGLDSQQQKSQIIQGLICEIEEDISNADNLDNEKESENASDEDESLVGANTQEEIEKQSEDISNEEQSSLEENIQQQIHQNKQDLECLNTKMCEKKAVLEALENLLKQNNEEKSSLKVNIEQQTQQYKQDIHSLELEVHQKKAVVEALNNLLK